MSESSPTPTFTAFDWRAVVSARAGARLGGRVVFREAVGSTNLLARDLMRRGAVDGTVVLTDDQTSGRGRLGRTWIMPPRAGLALTICLQLPSTYPLQILPPAAALAVGDVVAGIVGSRCTLKWPNDVLVDGAKVCGILAEIDRVDDGWNVALGIGLNVNAAPPLPTATSLRQATGMMLAREPLLLDLLAALERYLDRAATEPDAVITMWRGRLTIFGSRLRIQAPGGVLEGVAIDVAADGALLLRLDDGTVMVCQAGDVTLSPVQDA